MQLVQNGDTRPLPFFMVQSSDHASPLTGAVPAVVISKNGAAFAAPAGAVAEIGNGWYKLTPTATDTGTNGMLLVHATASGGDPADFDAQIVAFNPYDSVRGGLAALPGVAAGAAGGLPLGNAAGNVSVAGYATGQDPATLVLDASAAAHTVAGTIGADINAAAAGGGASGGATVAQILDGSLAGHSTAGTVGAALGNLVNALTESYAVNGQPASLAQLLYGIFAMLANVSQSGAVLTATRLDGSSQAMSFTLDSATAPSSRKRAA